MADETVAGHETDSELDGRTDGPPVSAWLTVAFAIAGIGISIYLTVLHYAKISPICTTGGSIDCGAVITSQFSIIGHFWPFTMASETIKNIPITVPGMMWFAISGGLGVVILLRDRRGQSVPEWLTLGHVLWGALGVLSVLYLIRAEAAVLHKFCEWCTGVHLLVFASFVVALFRWQRMMAARYNE